MSNHLDLPPVFDRPSTRAMIVAVFTALSLATNYALISFQNIKLIDTLVFIVAFLFGVRLGIGVAVASRLAYGWVNPNGIEGPVILSVLILEECCDALSGAIR